MKETSIPSRVSMFITGSLDTIVQPKKPMQSRYNRQERREFFYYLKVVDNDTQEIVGHLADISTGGFKLDSQTPLPINKEIRFRLNLTSEVADKPYLVFVARSRWCKVDPIDPYIYNIGFQLTHISPGDLEIFNRMMEKYGREQVKRYFELRNSNKW